MSMDTASCVHVLNGVNFQLGKPALTEGIEAKR